MPDLDLGAFRLTSPFARGAMGEVWRAWHRDQRLPVALKVLTGTKARDQKYVRHFQNEVRAVARLDHPHIVTLLDVGTVDDKTAARSAGRLVAGSPWIAMEYASDGTLKARSPTRWPEVRYLLLALLDALAHAHARGIVHRDLKPANVLFAGDRDARPGPKLTDFGIAARFGEEDLMGPGAGTPAYMAPEQLMGESGALGPWTDLYGLGCMAWRLTTGKLPFNGLKRMALVRAHLLREPPAYLPMMDVPDAFESWLRALLCKRPEDRPQRAADAAAALAALDGTLGSGTGTAPDDGEVAWGAGDTESSTTLGTLLQSDLETAEAPEGAVTRRIGPPDRVAGWREPTHVRPPSLVGAGLGLFGLREPPLVGRSVEQDLLWDELRTVHATRAPRLVTITGSAGCGKTRLATWLCRRADEVGAARVLWVRGVRGDDGGMIPMLASLLGCGTLEGDARQRHLVERLGSEDLAATVTALLAGELPISAHREVCARLLSQAASDRPVVLCIDDAQWSGPDLEVCGALLARPAAVLLVLVAQDESLAAQPAEAEILARLPKTEVVLGPLDAGARRALVQALVTFEEDLASQIEARAAGNPMFTIQLVGDWVQRGWIVAGPRGFTLHPDARRAGALALPDGLHDVWLSRVQLLLDDLPEGTAWDLEVAAAIGPDVDDATWHTACDDPDARGVSWKREGLKRRSALVERLLRARLATDREDGWAFAHEMLRESVVRRSREQGRWARACEVGARALDRPGHRRADPDRIGRLLLEGGRPAEAVQPLLEGVDRWVRGSVRDALALLVLAEQAGASAGLEPSDSLSGRLLVARARVHAALGEPSVALQWASDALREALTWHPAPSDPQVQRDGDRWGVHYRHALDVQLGVHLNRRDLPAARAAFEQLSPLVRALDDPQLLGDLLNAEAGLSQGDPAHAAEADALLVRAIACYEQAAARPEAVASALINRAAIAKENRKLERAQDLLQQAVDRLQGTGSRYLHGIGLASAAEIQLLLGRDRTADQLARRAISILDALGHPASDARVMLALALSAQGSADPALAEATRALRSAIDHGRTELVPLAALACALIEARLSRWAAVHDRLREAERAARIATLDNHTRSIAGKLAAVSSAGNFPQLAARARALAT